MILFRISFKSHLYIVCYCKVFLSDRQQDSLRVNHTIFNLVCSIYVWLSESMMINLLNVRARPVPAKNYVSSVTAGSGAYMVISVYC